MKVHVTIWLGTLNNIKFYPDNDDHLTILLRIVDMFRLGIRKEFGLDKRRIQAVRIGHYERHIGYWRPLHPSYDQNNVIKYPGILEGTYTRMAI